MKTLHPTRFFSLSLLRSLLCLSLILGVCVPLNLVPEAEAAAADCRPTSRHLGRVKQKIRLARRIRNGAQRRRILNRLTKTQTQLRRQYRRCLAAPAPAAAAAPASFIEMVPVGNPGNGADPLNSAAVPGIGAVADAFQIGKYEVTLDQYTAFLNAVAATDTNGLYNASMEITQSGSAGAFTYAPSASGNHPVNYVSWFDAARFCNWLHNGMPAGAQDAGTTETGAYALNGATSGAGFVREATATYWIPSDDEWYKAAWHDPRDEAAGGPPGDDHYWQYPTMSDVAPTAEAPPGGANSANFNQAVGGVTDGGAYLNSPSYYGTFDQGGNLAEWSDTVVFDDFVVFRGDSWLGSESRMRSSWRVNTDPDEVGFVYGFRIASP